MRKKISTLIISLAAGLLSADYYLIEPSSETYLDAKTLEGCEQVTQESSSLFNYALGYLDTVQLHTDIVGYFYPNRDSNTIVMQLFNYEYPCSLSAVGIEFYSAGWAEFNIWEGPDPVPDSTSELLDSIQAIWSYDSVFNTWVSQPPIIYTGIVGSDAPGDSVVRMSWIDISPKLDIGTKAFWVGYRLLSHHNPTPPPYGGDPWPLSDGYADRYGPHYTPCRTWMFKLLPGYPGHLQWMAYGDETGDWCMKYAIEVYESPPPYRISGNLYYYSNHSLIGFAWVYLTGGREDTTFADAQGYYIFQNLPGYLDYQVCPAKDNDERDAITPFDASHTLRFYAGLLHLNPYQRIAADVTGNGDITPYDASYILRYYVGLLDSFPVGKDWAFVPDEFSIDTTNWFEAPSCIFYDSLHVGQNQQDFLGLVYGDVSGSWGRKSIITRGYFTKGEDPFSVFRMVDLNAIPGEEIVVPINLECPFGIHSLGLTINYDPKILNLIEVKKGEMVRNGSQIAYYDNETGDLRIAIAATQTIDRNGEILSIRFKVRPDVPLGSTSTIEIIKVDMDEVSVSRDSQSPGENGKAKIYVGEEISFPQILQLHQNRPNPFIESTEIEYSLPFGGHLLLKIYDVSGRMVKILVDDREEAGYHSTKWDGKDQFGHKLPAGIYFCMFQTGSYRKILKMTLLK